MREKRAAGADPGPPSTGARAGAVGRKPSLLSAVVTAKATLVTVAIACVLVLLASALPPVSSWSLGQSDLAPFVASGPSAPPEYPYSFPVSDYPTPTSLPSFGSAALVHVASSSTGTDYLVYANNSSRSLWLSQGTADPVDVRALVDNQACLSGSGPTCVPTRSVYLTWGKPTQLWSPAAGYSVSADEVALNLLLPIDIGWSVLLGIIMGLVLGTFLSGVLPQLSQYVTTRSAYQMEGFVNGTVSQSSNQPWWRTLADAFAWFDTGFTTTTGAATLGIALCNGPGAQLTNSAEGFALAVIGAALEFSVNVIPAWTDVLSIAALGACGLSLITDFRAVLLDRGESPATKDLDYATFALDAGTVALGVSSLA